MLTCRIGISLALLTIATAAERTAPASPEELAGITERGRLLAAYDDAAWKATDALQAMKPDTSGLGQYIAKKSDAGWSVAFGRLSKELDAFLIAYEATRRDGASAFDVAQIKPARRDTGFFLFAARALKLAVADFTGAQRPYNAAVLPASDGNLYVYILPAQTKAGVFPLGGDARYLVSPDGQKIIGKRELHKAILEIERVPGREEVAGSHTAVVDDVPEDTDVFHVLVREPKMPEWVSTKRYVYVIAPDGSIKFLMTTEELRKIPEDQGKHAKP